MASPREKIFPNQKLKKNKQHTTPPSSNHYFLQRIKAFIIDLFMIYTPILYITTYLILGSKEAFQENQEAIFICVLLYGIISSLFLSIASQTPGMRAQELLLQRLDHSKPSFFLSFMRFFVWLLSVGLAFGLVFPFFRKDKQCFHDLICRTKITISKSLK